MKMTDEKLRNFKEIMRKTAEKHGCRIVYNTNPGFEGSLFTNFSICDAISQREFKIDWSEVDSLTEAAVTVWGDYFSAPDMRCYTVGYYNEPNRNLGVLKDLHIGVLTPNKPEIKDVIFNDPATVVFWTDGTKTVVKTQDGEPFDPEKGLVMAIAKKSFGNQGNYYNEIRKWVDKYDGCDDCVPFGQPITLDMSEFAAAAQTAKDCLERLMKGM